MVRQRAPWDENIGKRQVQAPKIYFRDTGLLHELLGIQDAASLRAHPKSGASWEEEFLRPMRAHHCRKILHLPLLVAYQ